MRSSQFFMPTLRENPSEAQIVSHRLLRDAPEAVLLGGGRPRRGPEQIRAKKDIDQRADLFASLGNGALPGIGRPSGLERRALDRQLTARQQQPAMWRLSYLSPITQPSTPSTLLPSLPSTFCHWMPNSASLLVLTSTIRLSTSTCARRRRRGPGCHCTRRTPRSC